MIAYEILVQTIADWKSGVRPTAPNMPPLPAGAPEAVEELESGVVDFEEAQEYPQDAEGQYVEGQYGEGQYGEAQHGEAQYGDAQYGEGEYAYEDDEQ